MFKYIVFDLDNTLYNYDIVHEQALKYIFELINLYTKINIDVIKNEYNKVNKQLKIELIGTGSSHSRIIYFKNLIYNLNITNYFTADILNNEYWTVFYNNMKLNDNIIDLLNFFKKNNIKLGIITNFTLEIQYNKLKYLNILEFFDKIISSEDTLFEKPHPYIYLKLLQECNCNSNEILIIGDSYKNDIEPALKLGFNACHLNLKQDISINYFENYISFNNTTNLYIFWKELFEELDTYTYYSKRIGERYDLTQTGGGNISFKYKNLMIIKASGSAISEVKYTIIDLKKLLNDFIENINQNINEYKLFNTNYRPSIETYMHSFLNKIVIHIHPLIFLRVLIKKHFEFDKLYENYLLINYLKPGFELAQNIYKDFFYQNIILLKNHGIIITGQTFEEVFEIINNITQKLEDYLNITYLKYKFTNTISNIINKNQITYLSEDFLIKKYLDTNLELFINNNFFPDKLIYCNINCLIINNEIELNNIEKSNNSKIIIYDRNLYIISNSLNKCRQIEEMIKTNLLVIKDNINLIELNDIEIKDLLNRDDEKYRINII
jgi:putative hydrolase of the HAD superfamily